MLPVSLKCADRSQLCESLHAIRGLKLREIGKRSREEEPIFLQFHTLVLRLKKLYSELKSTPSRGTPAVHMFSILDQVAALHDEFSSEIDLKAALQEVDSELINVLQQCQIDINRNQVCCIDFPVISARSFNPYNHFHIFDRQGVAHQICGCAFRCSHWLHVNFVSLIKRHLVLRIPTSGISETPPLGLHRLATNLQRHPAAGKEDDSAGGGGSCVRRASLHHATSAQVIQHASLTDSVVSDGHVRAYDVLFKWLQWKHESEDKGKGLPLNQQDANMRARMKFLDLAPLLAMFEFSK